ncbi:MAG: aminoacyl-tRNA hydrolase [Clostridia bacterium]|nr:aminoacyl-tRNA hydrolase [Clostridia bacterium]
MTRHNVGFVALDLLAEKAGLGRLTKTKCKAVYGTGTIAGKSVLLMKPQTYMNLSGEAVRDMMQAFSVPPERLIVIFDDADLAPGRIRIRKNGSAGTHNGMRNIVYLLENDKFPRIKVGIGKPDKEHGEEMVDFVLSAMDSDTFAACKAVPDLIYDLLENGIDHAMQEFNKFTPTAK